MKCPKCGFDQPEDRFCANCGVDVALYTPQRKVLKSFFRSATFFVLLSTLVLVLGTWFMFSRKLTNDTIVLNADRPTSVFRKARPTTDTEETAMEEASVQVDSANLGEENIPPPSAPAPPPPPSAPVLKPLATTFRISFYEVDLNYVSTLLGITIDGTPSSGIVRDDTNSRFADRLQAAQGNGAAQRIVSRVQTISTDVQTPNTFSFVSSDPRVGEIGLLFQLRAGQLNETGSTVSIEIRRIIGREDANQADVLNYQRELTIPLRAPSYIVGLVRGRNPIDANEVSALAANPVFSVFRSERFRANQSLLVVFLEAVERP